MLNILEKIALGSHVDFQVQVHIEIPLIPIVGISKRSDQK